MSTLNHTRQAAGISVSVCAESRSQGCSKTAFGCLQVACSSSLLSLYACLHVLLAWHSKVMCCAAGWLCSSLGHVNLGLQCARCCSTHPELAWVAASCLYLLQTPTCGIWLSQDLLYTVRQRLEKAVASTRLPPWPAAAIATSRRATIFLARRFGKALRLLHSVLAFDGFLPRRSASLPTLYNLHEIALSLCLVHADQKICFVGFHHAKAP